MVNKRLVSWALEAQSKGEITELKAIDLLRKAYEPRGRGRPVHAISRAALLALFELCTIENIAVYTYKEPRTIGAALKKARRDGKVLESSDDVGMLISPKKGLISQSQSRKILIDSPIGIYAFSFYLDIESRLMVRYTPALPVL